MLPFETIWAIADPAGKVLAAEVGLAAAAEEEEDEDAALLLELLLELPPQAAARIIATAAIPPTINFNDFKPGPPVLL